MKLTFLDKAEIELTDPSGGLVPIPGPAAWKYLLKVLTDLIDADISRWHNMPRGGGMSLHVYLGLTWDEYARWVEVPGALVDIVVKARDRWKLESRIFERRSLCGGIGLPHLTTNQEVAGSSPAREADEEDR